MWNLCRQRAQCQHDGQQQHSMDHAGQIGHATGTDVDHRAHGSSGTRQRTEETGHAVADALADQFLVGIMLAARHVVRYQ